jgi:hypothetical protein
MKFLRSYLVHGALIAGFLWPCYSFAQGDVPEAVDLPFATEDIEGRKLVTLRHKASYNLETKQLSWEVMEADLQGAAKVVVLPGSVSLEEGQPKNFHARLEVRGGIIESQPEIHDEFWTARTQIQLDPRSLRWNEPLILGDDIALIANLFIDTREPEMPIRWIPHLDLHSLTIGRLETGTYLLQNFTADGIWTSPQWKLDNASGEIFGGMIIASGQGRWGTNLTPQVSLDLQGHGVALQDLLRAFNSPRAGQVQARIGGAMRVEAEGRDWRVLNMEFYGEEGTVFIHRQLLYDLLAPSFTEALKKEDVEKALNSVFGDAQMIPFDEMRISGSLSPGKLNMKLPLRNEPLNLLIEPQIDRELVWDAYDFLVKMGLENIRSREFEVERENPTAQP